MALIDIILPTFNNGVWLKEAVLSILNQTFKDFRLLIVDDHSNDNSLLTIPKDSRIKILSNPHKGLVTSLNYGLRNSSSPWIARADGDDICYPQRLEKQINLAREKNLDWVSCQVKSFRETGILKGFVEYENWHNLLISQKDILNSKFIECPMIHPTWLLKRKIFEEMGVYREGDFPEDYEFFLRASKNHKLGKVNEVLYLWRDWDNRVSRSFSNFSKDAFRKLKVSYFPLPRQTPFYIWGTGNGGRRLARDLLKNNFNLRGFIDISLKKIGRKIYSLPIISTDDFFSLREKPFVINAVMTRNTRDQITSWLLSKGYQIKKDFLHFH